MYILGIVFCLLSLLATILPFSKVSKWYIRDLDFPRLQILFLAVVAAVILLVFNPNSWSGYMFLGFSVLSIGLQLRFILPYTLVWPKEVNKANSHDDLNTISLVICNVFMKNEKNGKCLDVTTSCDPDLLFFVETDNSWEEHLRELDSNYPFTLKYPQDNTYGMLLFSRFELVDFEVKFLIKDSIPSFHGQVKLPSGKKITIRLVHPEPPAPGEKSTSKNRDAELVIIAKEVRDLEEPVLVCGDLNDVAWSHTTRLFQRISRLLDPRKGRGMYNTFNAKYTLIRWPLDHVFFSKHFSLLDLKRLPHTGSDHFPIYIKLHLDSKGQNYSPDSSSNGDHKEADEKVEKRK